MGETEINSTDVVRTSESIEESLSVSHWQVKKLFGGHNITIKETAKVGLQRVNADVGGGAGIRMLLTVVDLSPKDISLDACRDPDPSESLSDDISSRLAVEVAFKESVGYLVLEMI